MKRRPAFFDFVTFLDEIGFIYHDSGAISNKGCKVADYFKGDTLTDDIKEKLNIKFGKWVAFSKSQKEYAPEQVKPIVMFLSAKEYQRRMKHEQLK